MAVFKAYEISSALLRKGFKKSEGKHHFYEYVHGNKIVAKTMMSHNDQEIGPGLLTKMYKGCKLPKNKFIGLIDCSLTQQEYETELRSQGIIK